MYSVLVRLASLVCASPFLLLSFAELIFKKNNQKCWVVIFEYESEEGE